MKELEELRRYFQSPVGIEPRKRLLAYVQAEHAQTVERITTECDPVKVNRLQGRLLLLRSLIELAKNPS